MAMVLRLILLTGLAMALAGCSKLFFYPMEPWVQNPENQGLSYEDVVLIHPRGLRLHGWWLPAKGEAKGSVLFLHGNAENISTHIGSVMFLPEQGLNVFLFDYRGYGRSEGIAYLEGLLMDVEAGLGQLLVYDKTDNLAVFGQSLGAALAILVVADSRYKEKIGVLVADSSFTSFREITREKLSSHWLTWLFQWPLAMTVADDYRPIDEISKLHPTAVILVHSKADRVVQFHHSETLYNIAREPKYLWVIENSSHNEFFSKLENQTELAKRLKGWFK